MREIEKEARDRELVTEGNFTSSMTSTFTPQVPPAIQALERKAAAFAAAGGGAPPKPGKKPSVAEANAQFRAEYGDTAANYSEGSPLRPKASRTSGSKGVSWSPSVKKHDGPGRKAAAVNPGEDSFSHLSDPGQVSITTRRLLFLWMRHGRKSLIRKEKELLRQQKIILASDVWYANRAGFNKRKRSGDNGDGNNGGSDTDEEDPATALKRKRQQFRPKKRLMRIERYLDDLEELDRLCIEDPVNLVKKHLERVYLIGYASKIQSIW
jgi:hypothetical protein